MCDGDRHKKLFPVGQTEGKNKMFTLQPAGVRIERKTKNIKQTKKKKEGKKKKFVHPVNNEGAQ